MKKILLGFAALLAVLIVTAVVAPSFIDWTTYRNGIAAEIERALGRRVVIDGAVEASIVPTPRLSLHGVRLGNPVGASSPTMAQAESLEVRVAFWPLLTGKIVVTSVVLRKPVIELERLADGRGNWLFTGAGRTRSNEVLPEGVQFENAVITDGTVIYRDARSGAEEKLEGVNGRFAADGIYGPLRVVGELRYGSVPVRFSLSTGRLDPRGQTATPVNFMAEVRGAARGLTRTQPVLGTGNFTGTIRLAEAGAQLGGQVKLRGDDLADFVESFGMGGNVPAFLAQGFNLEGALELKNDTLTANSLSVQLGETRAQGAVNGAFSGDEPQFDIALTLGRIDFDAWRAAAAKKDAVSKSSGEKATTAEADEFILPVNIRVTLDVSADALTYRGGAARQAKLAAELSDGVVDIHQFSVQLPGATDASFNGKLLAAEGYARLDGQAELASDDFRSFLGWLDVDATELPAGRLNKVSASSHLAFTRDMLDLGDLDLRFDSTRLTGALVVALRERPALGVNLIVDQINLDSYLAPEMAAAAEAAASQAAHGVIPLTVLTEFDANLRVRVGQLEKGKTRLRNATLDGTLVNGLLTMRKLAIADLAGGSVNLAGTLDGFRDKLRMNLEFDVDADEPAGFLRLTGLALPLPDSALKPLSAHGKISGSNSTYKIDGTVNAAVMALSLKGDLALPPNAPAKVGLDVSVEHPNYIGFVRLLDPEFAPEQEAEARAVSLNGRVESKGQDYNLSALSGRFGPLTVDGNLSLAFDGALPRVTAQLSTGDIDTRHFLSAPQKPAPGGADEHWSTTPIDLDLARIIDGYVTITGKSLHHGKWTIGEPKAELALGGGGLDVKQLTGQMLGGQLALHGRIAPTGRTEAAMALDYTLSLSGADLSQALFDSPGIDLLGGRLDLAVEGAGVGTSEAALLASMNGKGSITLENTAVKGFDLARLNGRYGAVENPGELVRLIQSSMSSGSTKITKLNGDFTITDGVAAFDDLRITSQAGDVRALLAADFPHWRLDATAEVRLASASQAPAFEMQLGGPLNAPKRDFDSYALQAYLLEESARRSPGRPAPQNTPPQNTPAPQTRQAPQSAPSSPQNVPPPRLSAPPAQNPPQTPPPSSPTSQNAPQRPPASQGAPAPSTAPTSQGSPSQSAPASPSAPAAQTVPTSQTAPRVLSVSPNAPAATAIPPQNAVPQNPNAPERQPGTNPNRPAAERPVPGSRVLSVSPNAAAPASPVPGARVLSVSPNAERSSNPPPADTPGRPIESTPLPPESSTQPTLGMPPAGQPAPPPQSAPQPATPQPGTSDPESFARDILRGLGP